MTYSTRYLGFLPLKPNLYVFLNANVEENESKAPGEKSG
jgi:hypothetical protein